ncbi:chaperone modulator CbpM [Robiginitalea sp. IMCC43444]|jgi:hypothetical protein|uniref:chaperone modulator CbpM n=1 Tax=Robiginitalea sp. IMCC43444 TaxID=3459121 RepID=UPI0040422614
MERDKYIRIIDFCEGHGLETRFLYELQEFELISIQKLEKEEVFHRRELRRLERLLRLHRDLHINPQGLQAVDHLLNRVQQLEEEVLQLRRALGRYGT